MALPESQQPTSLARARSRRQRLDRLEQLLGRVVGVQAGLVEAVDRLERRTGLADRRAHPAPIEMAPRRPRRVPAAARLAIQVLGALLAGLAVAVVFSSGQTLHPSVGMPPAVADPTTTTATLAITPGTAGGQPGGGVVGGRVAAVGGQAAGAGGLGERATRPAAVAVGATAAAAPTSTTTTLPGVTSTTLPPLPETTLPAVPTTTLCRNPKHCDDDG